MVIFCLWEDGGEMGEMPSGSTIEYFYQTESEKSYHDTYLHSKPFMASRSLWTLTARTYARVRLSEERASLTADTDLVALYRAVSFGSFVVDLRTDETT